MDGHRVENVRRRQSGDRDNHCALEKRGEGAGFEISPPWLHRSRDPPLFGLALRRDNVPSKIGSELLDFYAIYIDRPPGQEIDDRDNHSVVALAPGAEDGAPSRSRDEEGSGTIEMLAIEALWVSPTARLVRLAVKNPPEVTGLAEVLRQFKVPW